MSTTLAFAPTECEAITHALPLPDTLPALPPLPAPAWDMPQVSSFTLRRQRARLTERIFQWGVCALMLLSSGAAIYRMLWMGH